MSCQVILIVEIRTRRENLLLACGGALHTGANPSEISHLKISKYLIVLPTSHDDYIAGQRGV